MKWKGLIYDNLESGFEVTQVVITKDRLAIDWDDEYCPGHLEGVSSDGFLFHGHYGYPRSDPDYEFEMKRYDSGQDVLFLGTWTNHKEGNRGVWMISLPHPLPPQE